MHAAWVAPGGGRGLTERTGLFSPQFENWAPRSSRAWRGVGWDADWKTESDAQNYRGEAGAAGGGLLAELKEASAAIAEEEAAAAALQPAEVAGGAWTGEVGEVGEPAEDDFATAFAARLQEVGTSDVVAEAEAEEEDADPLTGVELAEICHAKYGKFHDMAIKHVTINKSGMRRWVALNIYVGSLGQRSFPYSKEEYLEKLDAVAALLTAWNCCAYVRAFFEEPPIPRRGLPSYPRVDTAVSLRLNQCPLWDDELAEEYFTY